MKNTFGNVFSVTIAGESHGKGITVIVDGVKSGIKLDADIISKALSLRRPSGAYATDRIEKDEFEITSGLYNGYSCGTPITVFIPNNDVNDDGYGFFRPGHSDYASFARNGEYADLRGGGHTSGRVTVSLSVAGAIASSILCKKGIICGTHISRCCGVQDRSFTDYRNDISELTCKNMPLLDENAANEIESRLYEIKKEGNTAGAILETAVLGVPKGTGEPFFDSVESIISHIVFSVPGVKGIEFGDGFAATDMKGSEYNDEMRYSCGRVVHLKNSSGGINGGFSNGMPIVFRTSVRPASSVSLPQRTVSNPDMKDMECVIKGRNDVCFAPRAAHVINAATQCAVLDLLCTRFGTELIGL